MAPRRHLAMHAAAAWDPANLLGSRGIESASLPSTTTTTTATSQDPVPAPADKPQREAAFYLPSTGPIQNIGQRSGDDAGAVPVGEDVVLGDSDVPILPRGDVLDKRIFAIFLPAMLNYLLIPFTGAVDCFWVGKMGDALALAGQSAANQVFASTFFLSSFLPAVVSPLVAAAKNNQEVQDRCHQAMWMALVVGALASIVLTAYPQRVLSALLPNASPALAYALPYLRVRSVTLLPSLLSTVAFAVFRGSLDIVTPLRIAFVSNMVNIILDPLFMFVFRMGVPGAAAATCVADIVSFAMYFSAMHSRKLFDLKRFLRVRPTFLQIAPLLSGGASIQARALAIECAFLAVSRATQRDASGNMGAAHAVCVQLWQLGSVVLLAMSTAGSTLVPVEVVRLKRLADEGRRPFDLKPARKIANRVVAWGGLLGLALGGAQLGALPLVNAFSPIKAVQDAARLPVMISALLQVINGLTFTGEGIQQVRCCFHLFSSGFDILLLTSPLFSPVSFAPPHPENAGQSILWPARIEHQRCLGDNAALPALLRPQPRRRLALPRRPILVPTLGREPAPWVLWPARPEELAQQSRGQDLKRRHMDYTPCARLAPFS